MMDGSQQYGTASVSSLASPAKTERDPHLDSALYTVYQEIHEMRMVLDDQLGVLAVRLRPVSNGRDSSMATPSDVQETAKGASAMYQLLVEERDGLRRTLQRVRTLMDELEI